MTVCGVRQSFFFGGAPDLEALRQVACDFFCSRSRGWNRQRANSSRDPSSGMESKVHFEAVEDASCYVAILLPPEHHIFPRVVRLLLQRPRGLLVVDVKLSHSVFLNPSLSNCRLSNLSPSCSPPRFFVRDTRTTADGPANCARKASFYVHNLRYTS